MSDKKVHLQPDNLIALWRNRAYTTVHPMPTGDELEGLISAGSYPKFPAVPQYFEAVDAADFIFTFRVIPDSKKGEAGWIWIHPAFGSSPKEFTTLVAACEDAYWHHSGLAADITRLKRMGVEVRPGIEGTSYWRWKVTVSPLFPTTEAAWRAAIRELGARGAIPQPSPLHLSNMKEALQRRGYTFTDKGWKNDKGMCSGGMKWTQADAIINAWEHYHLTDIANAKTDTMGDNIVQPVFPNIAPGEPYPAVRTDVVVTPHNTQWGFSKVDDYLCTVLAYDGDYVWLRVAHYDGPHSGSRISTRVDKVDFRPSEEQP